MADEKLNQVNFQSPINAPEIKENGKSLKDIYANQASIPQTGQIMLKSTFLKNQHYQVNATSSLTDLPDGSIQFSMGYTYDECYQKQLWKGEGLGIKAPLAIHVNGHHASSDPSADPVAWYYISGATITITKKSSSLNTGKDLGTIYSTRILSATNLSWEELVGKLIEQQIILTEQEIQDLNRNPFYPYYSFEVKFSGASPDTRYGLYMGLREGLGLAGYGTFKDLFDSDYITLEVQVNGQSPYAIQGLTNIMRNSYDQIAVAYISSCTEASGNDLPNFPPEGCPSFIPRIASGQETSSEISITEDMRINLNQGALRDLRSSMGYDIVLK